MLFWTCLDPYIAMLAAVANVRSCNNVQNKRVYILFGYDDY